MFVICFRHDPDSSAYNIHLEMIGQFVSPPLIPVKLLPLNLISGILISLITSDWTGRGMFVQVL